MNFERLQNETLSTTKQRHEERPYIEAKGAIVIVTAHSTWIGLDVPQTFGP
jgi:hypothetical protein